jgi:hypothetical protein
MTTERYTLRVTVSLVGPDGMMAGAESNELTGTLAFVCDVLPNVGSVSIHMANALVHDVLDQKQQQKQEQG